jgi:hypothetical protein
MKTYIKMILISQNTIENEKLKLQGKINKKEEKLLKQKV